MTPAWLMFTGSFLNLADTTLYKRPGNKRQPWPTPLAAAVRATEKRKKKNSIRTMAPGMTVNCVGQMAGNVDILRPTD